MYIGVDDDDNFGEIYKTYIRGINSGTKLLGLRVGVDRTKNQFVEGGLGPSTFD